MAAAPLTDILGVGVAGCGRAAVELHLPALARLPGIKVTALADPDSARLNSANCPGGGVSRYENYRDLLADPSVQVVLITVPTPLHHDTFLAAVQAGKHIYVEKPLALNLDQADRMLRAVAGSRSRTVLGFNLRSHRLVRKARECIKSGILGRILALRTVLVGGIRLEERASWQRCRADGGGAVYELGSHHFDLWRFLLETEASEVRAQTFSSGSDDSAVSVSARFASGVLATSFFALYGSASHEVEIIGETARLRFSLYRSDSFEIQPAGRAAQLKRWLNQLPAASWAARQGGDYRDSYRVHWRHFLDSIPDGNPPATIEDGRKSLCIALAAFESAGGGAAV
jgi:predicted dehydrogenase